MKKSTSSTTIAWWLGWITLTILSFFVSCYFWTGFIAKHVGTMDKPGLPVLWVTAVFGSWMLLLVPLIIMMYSKVDKTYEDARISRETKLSEKAKKDFPIKSIYVDDGHRLLSKDLTLKLKKYPETIKRGHLVDATLKNGERVNSVFVLDRKDVLGVYGVSELSFNIQDIVDVVPVPYDKIPNFTNDGWLRLDGAGA